MKLLLSALKTPIWRISEIDYIEALENSFNETIKIKEITNPERKFKYEWLIENENFFLEGFIDKQFTGIYFETNSEDLALTLINLTRKFMPIDAEILIYNEDFSISCKVPYDGINLNELSKFQ